MSLSTEEVNKIAKVIEKTATVEGDLRHIEPGPLRDAEAISVAEFPDWYSGSVAPDGTLFGVLHSGPRDIFDIKLLDFEL